MTRKNRLGDVDQVLQATGAEVLRKVATRGRAEEKPAPEPKPTREKLVPTTLRIRESHLKELRRRAFERAQAEGGRIDMSAALNEALDQVL